jgi:hypothetical protein
MSVCVAVWLCVCLSGCVCLSVCPAIRFHISLRDILWVMTRIVGYFFVRVWIISKCAVNILLHTIRVNDYVLVMFTHRAHANVSSTFGEDPLRTVETYSRTDRQTHTQTHTHTHTDTHTHTEIPQFTYYGNTLFVCARSLGTSRDMCNTRQIPVWRHKLPRLFCEFLRWRHVFGGNSLEWSQLLHTLYSSYVACFKRRSLNSAVCEKNVLALYVLRPDILHSWYKFLRSYKM